MEDGLPEIRPGQSYLSGLCVLPDLSARPGLSDLPELFVLPGPADMGRSRAEGRIIGRDGGRVSRSVRRFSRPSMGQRRTTVAFPSGRTARCADCPFRQWPVVRGVAGKFVPAPTVRGGVQAYVFPLRQVLRRVRRGRAYPLRRAVPPGVRMARFPLRRAVSSGVRMARFPLRQAVSPGTRVARFRSGGMCGPLACGRFFCRFRFPGDRLHPKRTGLRHFSDLRLRLGHSVPANIE